MDWRVLGPLEVWADGSPVNLGGRQRRLVLAILVANADQTVSTDRLIEEVWGDLPPDSARKTVQAHVAHLRRVLNSHSEFLFSSGDGYLVSPDSGSVDADRFEAAVAVARSADPPRTGVLLEEALDMFRGEPYAGLADDALTVKVEASRLQELRQNAREERLEALLATGRATDVAAEAHSLLAEHPLRERLWAIQMLALYRSGRQSEALRSYSQARQILGEELGIEPSNELQALEQQILEQDPSLTDSTTATTAAPRTVDIRRNPFKGLRAFDEADANDFFGRGELVRQLVDRLTARPPVSLTVLAGPSGAGKSSVLRAGLLPVLRDRGLAVADMFPGGDPDTNLDVARREALSEMGRDPQTDTVDVVAVDQFEELFTQASAQLTDRFIARMNNPADPRRWVVAVRADFLGVLLAHPELGRRLQESLVLVPLLEDHEVESAIVEPAARVGVEVEPSLVATIVREVQSRASALPLMQYALTDLFERRRGDVLSLDAYEREGGLSGALVRRADQVFERLPPRGRDVARQILLQLATIADNGEFARRRVHRDSLQASEPELTGQVLEQFGAHRLLTFDQDPTSGDATVELAHESLLDVWPRLSRWIDGAREELLMRSALNNALAEWEASDRDESFLLSAGRLVQHESWTAETDLPLTTLEIEFLSESRRNADLESARRRRRRNLTMAGFGVAAIIATIFGLFALNNAREAEARGLVANASAVMDEDSSLALLLALQGASTLEDDAQALRVLRTAIANANLLHVEPIDERPFFPGELSPTGREVIVRRASSVELIDIESKRTVWTFETEMPESGYLQPVHVNGGKEVAVVGLWIPSEQDAFSAPPDGTAVHILDARTGELLRRYDIGTCGGELLQAEGTKLLYFSPTEEWYESNGCAPSDEARPGGAVSLLDTSSGQSRVVVSEPSGFLPLRPFAGFALSESAGALLIWDGEARTAVVEDSGTGERLGEIGQAPRTAQALAIASDESTVVIGGAPDADSRILHVYDVASGEEVGTLDGHAGRTSAMEFFDGGERLVTVGEDGLMKVWSMSSLELLDTFTIGGPQFWLSTSDDAGRVGLVGLSTISAVAIDSDEVAEVGALDACPAEPTFFHGASLVVRGELMLVRQGCGPEIVDFDGGRGHVFNLTTGDLVGSGPLGASQGVDLSPDGRFVASQRFDPETGMFGSVVVTDLQSGAHVEMEGLCEWSVQGPGEECETPPEQPFPMNVWDLDFSPSGELLVATDAEGRTGVVWKTQTGAQEAMWESHFAGFSSDGSLIVTFVSETLESRSTDDFSLAERRELRSDQLTGWYFDVAPDGVIVGATGTSELVFFDDGTLEEVRRWSGLHEAPIRDFDFSEDGSMIATASWDGFVKVWDMETGNLLHEIHVSEDDRVQSVAFASDDRHLWVSAEFGPLAGYTLDIDELLDIARERVVRGFTDAECGQYFPEEGCPTLEEIKSG